MHFESIKVTASGSAVAPILFVFEQPVAWNADIVADRYRKTVNRISMTCVQRFNCFPGMEEEFSRQFPDLVHPALKPAFTQHRRHQSGKTDKTDGCFHIATKITGGYQNYGSYPGICYFSIFWLFIAHGFQYIVKKCVYCNGFYYHGAILFSGYVRHTYLTDWPFI
jgi:hypothetical protein